MIALVDGMVVSREKSTGKIVCIIPFCAIDYVVSQGAGYKVVTRNGHESFFVDADIEELLRVLEGKP